jgi:hypothetical protein
MTRIGDERHGDLDARSLSRWELNNAMEHAANNSGVIVRIQYDSIRNYIYWSTLIGVFSGFLRIRVPFSITLFDGIMITNLILMPMVGSIVRLPARVLCFILYLVVSGGIGIAHGTDTIALVLKELLGVSVSLVYFYYFFGMIRNDFEKAFTTYANIAYWFAVIAFPIWVGACIYFGDIERLDGLTAEPTAFCILVLPAFYWYAYQYLTSRLYGGRVAIIIVAIILSSSTNGYIAGLFGVVLLLSRRGRLKYLVAAPIVIIGIAALAYTYSTDIRMRVNDTLRAVVTQNVIGANSSTYALISNIFVTRQVLKESPLIGNGLGSHPISHDRFLADIPGVATFIQQRITDLNSSEAASLGLRSLSELGILGFAGELIFVFYFYVGGAGTRAAISDALLVVFFLKLVRDGGYFAPEQFFFIFIYILNHRQRKLEVQSIVRRAPSKYRWCLSA